MRKGNFITTYTGIDFYIIDPHIDDINATDIAHALSLTCRANGHYKHFYSIAQHSINCFKEAKARGYSKKVKIACLLHDGSEAYISDITRPAKQYFPRYLEIEENIQNKVYEKFGISDLTIQELKQISDIDDTVLWYEFEALHNVPMLSDKPDKYANFDFDFKDTKEIENEFLRVLNRLSNNDKLYTAVGIDSCKYGWVVVSINSLGDYNAELIKNIDQILNVKADIYLIDMPIGLLENGTDERLCDKLIRRMLQPNRGSSVFPVPARKAIYTNSYKEALRMNKELTGKGLSKQSYAITPKIKEVDEFLLDHKYATNCLHESHPEVCFAEIIGSPCKYNKKSADGEFERINALRQYFNINKMLSEIKFPKKDVATDDIIDASVLAVIGLLGLKNGFKTIPENPPEDNHGLKMSITVMKRD